MTSPSFQYLLLLEPLGLLYGSTGRLLSPDALTGRAAEQFPPDSPVAAGLMASLLAEEQRHGEVFDLHTAGPFWITAERKLMLPAPLLLIQEEGGATGRQSSAHLSWLPTGEGREASGWFPDRFIAPSHKARTGGWISLDHWPHLPKSKTAQTPIPIHDDPWQAVPHLHPRLKDEERVSAGDDALFLEYGIALQPGVRLAYLSTHSVKGGLVRFGGEGHLALLDCTPIASIAPALLTLLSCPLAAPFALITPALWGGPKLSIREPIDTTIPRGSFPWRRHGIPPAILTERPRPWRHRLGRGRADSVHPEVAKAGRRRLSRGRWALPAGSCYHINDDKPIPPWSDWEESWFPKEGFSFKQLGTALALPITWPNTLPS
jgi:CRISPR-associated protein Cmr3